MKNKKIYTWGTAIILAIIIIVIIFLFFKNQENTNDVDSPSETTTSKSTVMSSTEIPTSSDISTSDESITTSTTKNTTTMTTSSNTPDITYPGGALDGSPDPLNPSIGQPQDISKGFVQSMFSINVGHGESYADKFNSLRGFMGTPDMSDNGFFNHTNDHNMAWKTYAGDEVTTVIAMPSFSHRNVINDNHIQYHYSVTQKLVNPKSTISITGFDVSVDMKHIDNKWLVSGINVITLPSIY